MDADTIVNSYFSPQEKLSQSTSPADNIVAAFFGKQTASPHPLDDSYVSKALADQGDQSYNNYCEAFAEQAAYGKQGLYANAGDAWNNYLKSGKAIIGNVQDAPKGSLIYWKPDASNFGDGHVSIADGQGNAIGATSQGVKSIPITQWQAITKQIPQGYVIPNH